MQRTIVEVQKATEMELLELQEFLQAEKVTLTNTLKDMEQEVGSTRASKLIFIECRIFI